MQNVILAAHIILCIAMTGIILLQRSEGGALGIGGGGGGLMSGRGAAGAMVRGTIIIGGLFFLTSLGLNRLANTGVDNRTAVERALEGDPVNDLGDPLSPTGDLLPPSSRDSVPEGDLLAPPASDTPAESDLPDLLPPPADTEGDDEPAPADPPQ